MDDVEEFRSRVEAAVADGDLAVTTLLLAPVIEEHGAARVAAALAALLREAEAGRPRAASGVTPAPDRATRPAWTKIFVNIGKKDGAGPGDLVGAITGETGAVAAQIGRIDVRPTFTLIDVDSLVVDDVIRGLSGSRIKGRDVRARRDRGRP
ncbi:MAG: DbpA RNA binding domain-containing protein [Gemmatimonadota bacterium]|nr:DbpA RNA binding domain-containing protein [Gemmatimonadota bacterium]